MNKFIYHNNKLTNTPYNHAYNIKRLNLQYDVIVRGIIDNNKHIIYIRINDLSIYQGIEYKRVYNQFEHNLKDCISYLKHNYKKYKIYNSYTINKLDITTRKELLNV